MTTMAGADISSNGKALLQEKVLTKDDLKPNDRWAHLRVNGILISLPVLLYLFHLFFDRSNYLVAALCFIFLGAQIYKVTIIFHDLAHFTLFSSKKISLAYIRICEALLGVSFSTYRKLHLHHHRWCGTDKDTEEGVYRELQGKNSLAVVWFLTEPLFGITYFKNFFGGRIKIDQSMLKPDKYTASKGMRIFNIILVQGLLFVFASHFFQNIYYVVVYPLSAMTFALFFSRIRGVAEHVPITEKLEPGKCFLRTHYFNPFDFLFFYCLNMNYHYEHHTYPQVPAANLPALSQKLNVSGLKVETESHRKSVLVTLLDIFKARVKG